MQTPIVSDKIHPVAEGRLEQALTATAPDTREGNLELDAKYFDPKSTNLTEPVARSFVTLPWEAARELATAIMERDGQMAGASS